jgi:Asp-tRNA(Asn)/Glu-tRNA(Gln) amidotransferase A subunit family amidase
MKKIIVCLLALGSIPCYAQQDTITKADINVAAKFLDLQFTDKEIDSMYGGVRDIIRNINRMHQLPLNNSVPMTLWQSPVLPGMKFNAKQEPINWNIPANVQLPKNKNDLAFYSILQLASLIKYKKISSVELTNFFLERIEKYDDSLMAVITITRDMAMEQAKQADAEIAKGKYRGPLHGIPYGIKDLFSVKGTKTTWGAAPYKEQVIEEDAYVYTRLKDAGAVLVAKFTLGALAMGDKWYGGRTNNPWNLQFGSSGSSAGSASATVAGLVPFAIGTETLGSIISPSNVCGATGLRPTFGSVSRTGAMTLSWSLDKIGPICRSAEDAAVVFAYIHGTDNKDASAVNMPFNYKTKVDIKKLKIAYAKNYFDRITDTSRNEWKVLKAFRSMGIEPTPVVFPDSGVYNFNIVGIVIGSEAAAAFDEFTRKNIDDEMTWQNRGDWPNYFRTARFYSAVDYINANRHRYLLMREVDKLFDQYDVIITPTYAGGQLAITNLTGHPAMSLPTGFNPRNNLPTSITFLGKLYGEANLIAVAKAFQQATPYEDEHPEKFK